MSVGTWLRTAAVTVATVLVVGIVIVAMVAIVVVVVVVAVELGSRAWRLRARVSWARMSCAPGTGC
ncbi:hypothetical protein [Streptomyces brasiliscabiei]|uniref:hypothetical protein n=1 Tax=Streptomyces brasiliscabiei TaxID=2736302 RepID=UPI00301556A6